MQLSRHRTSSGSRWALDGEFLGESFCLAELLRLETLRLDECIAKLSRFGPARGELMAPLDSHHELWAAGVTYLRSREARQAESSVADVYERVYDAERPELFFKGLGFRAVGHQGEVRLRRDSRWNVPEPELTLVVNAAGDIVGYCVGNDLSSRDIEGENPLYLPQAKVFNGASALGPVIELAEASTLADLPIEMRIDRRSATVFSGETTTARMKRSLPDLVSYLRRELDFPDGVLLLTGTGIVPPDDFTLEPGDTITIRVGSLELQNRVAIAQTLGG